MTDSADIQTILKQARKASKALLTLDDACVSGIIMEVADAIEASSVDILAANRLDLAKMAADDPKYDRLRLTPERIAAIASDMRDVARLPSPRRVIDSRRRPNGLEIIRVAVPFGVIGVIYEARPNVTADVFSLCFRSGNACVLKGGRDAEMSNAAIVDVIHGVLRSNGVDEAAATILPPTHEAADALMGACGLVDLIIPRGSSRLIESVRRQASVPVIETGAGVCHCYIDAAADVSMARDIVTNAKTRRVSVCNALDCVIVHRDRLPDLPEICSMLARHDVTIHADGAAFNALDGHYPGRLLRHSSADDYGTEFLGYEAAIVTVDSLDDALAHIDRYGSGHSEACVTADAEVGMRFQRDVDAACVYVNAPTSFTDGGQFGLGAEIGISTQKLHARGPMGLAELMTYKWLIAGQGQTRP